MATLLGCEPRESPEVTIGVAFETLQTEYWVASFDAFRDELSERGFGVREAVADGSADRQLDQVHALIGMGVDGLVIAPKDATTVVPMILAANRAQVPIVLYNRPPAANEGQSVTVVADNYKLARATVEYMIDRAREGGVDCKALVLIGDLADQNAIARRDGFEDAVAAHPDVVEVVARIPTEWSQEKALAGMTNSLLAHPEINFVFSSSDFLFPSVVSALEAAGKYHPVGDPGHVLLGGFDGDSMAYRMLVEGYLDADGVQDVFFECTASIDALLATRRGESPPPIVNDPGFVIHQGNLEEMAPRMWGARVALAAAAAADQGDDPPGDSEPPPEAPL
ncbi:sugar ABC transporter substrate-binding protein [Botrimarina sp.]|uniref:sugar ABC transporter substrate-binding protein n=1 Tax=Botrimarina sp. TaxID=2795802 RepID=UPI0032EC129D